MKLLVINQYYKPDFASTGQIAAEICESLVARGIEVHVVTGQPSYTAQSPTAPAREVVNGVHVYRLDLGGARGRDRLRTRILGYIRFLRKACGDTARLASKEKFDRVLTFHNPPFAGLIGAHLAKRFKIPFVYILYDIHPDVLVATGWMRLPRPVITLWDCLQRRALQTAHTVVVLGEGMKRTLVKGKGVPPEKVQVIPPWGRPELEPAPRNQPIRSELDIGEEELLLLYAGNIGIMHPVEPILDAAAALHHEPVHFLFVGDGAKREGLVRRVEGEGLKRVRFLPFQPEERFVQLVAASDACFVVLKPGLERLAVPSRAFTFLSAGRPLITLMSPGADIARLVTQTKCGWNVTDGLELTNLLRKLLRDRQELVRRGQRAKAVYDGRFRREQVIEGYVDVLMDKHRARRGNGISKPHPGFG